MLSALFTSVADALILYAIDKLDPAERIKSWLRLDPARLAFKKALARAYSAFARQYPEYTSSLFDQPFLSTDALPEFSKLLTRNQHPDPALLAQAWGLSLGTSADFAQAATKPAAYFLERFEAELKAEPALQSLFDSRTLESLPKLEAEIQKLSTDLQRGLDEALKAATDYQKVTLHIGGDVKNSNIVIGDNNNVINNYYYSGDFIALNEYYIPPDGVFQRVRVDEFVGRDWLTAKVDAFLNDPNRKSGAFLLIGDAGVGKTSFMAHLVKERRYLHLFAEQAPGKAMLQRAMQSLGSQLVTRYQIDPYKDRDTLNALSVFPDFLERILRLAASTLTEGEKIVIVCDALDEAGTFPDHFVFGLPKELPDGVYFILSQRPVNVKLPNFEPVIEKLEAQGEGNLQDMQAYLSAVVKRPEVAGQIRSKEYSEEFFIQTLKEKSQGVWMYLHYIIKEIESGARAPLDLANLPTGLVGYYAEYWDTWRTGKRGKGEEAWDDLYAPLLTTVAAAQEAIPVDWLIQWADVNAKPREVIRLLTEHWRAFFTEKDKDGKKTYTPYHLSFKDFITGKVDMSKLPPAQANLVKDLAAQTVDAHKRIVNAFEKECNGEWEKLVEQDYPRLHLTAHLNGAGEYEKLRIMLTEGDEKVKWAEAREKKEETYASYLNDLTYVWDYAEREQNYALAIRCMLIENSIHSLAANIPPELLAELAKAGIWSYERCLEVIRENSDSDSQKKSLRLIAADLPKFLLQEALSIAEQIKDESDHAHALESLAPFLGEELIQQVLRDARKLKYEPDRIKLLAELIPYLEDELKSQVLQESFTAAHQIKEQDDRFGYYHYTHAIVALAPHVEAKLKSQALQEAFVATRKLGPVIRVSELTNLIPHLGMLGNEIKSQAYNEAVNAIYETKACYNELVYSQVLEIFAPCMEDEIKSQIFKLACEITDESNRARVLISLVPYLREDLNLQLIEIIREIKDKNYLARGLALFASKSKNELKSTIMQEALIAAKSVTNRTNQASVLAILAPHFEKELRLQVLQDALTVTKKIGDEHQFPNTIGKFLPHSSDELKSQILADAYKKKR
ncbi:MAG: AAA family ATPase [Anaerolineales bacterium]|nr:MAG: AAA family ATPase [Anaerolineales bacterium]